MKGFKYFNGAAWASTMLFVSADVAVLGLAAIKAGYVSIDSLLTCIGTMACGAGVLALVLHIIVAHHYSGKSDG